MTGLASIGSARTMRHGRFVFWRSTLAGSLLVIAGCGNSADPARFIPAPSAAEQALRSGLDAWVRGEPPGPVKGTSPLVHVTDAGRKPKQKLASYEVLGETPGETGRTFVVRLQLKDPAEDPRVKYIVVGIDPLWVFREEDYALLTHWDHHMPAPPAGPKEP